MIKFIFSVTFFQVSAVLALPPVPAQYQYLSLVCGTPLPQPSATAQASLNTLYTQCLTQNCNQSGNYSGDFANKLAQAVFAEPQVLIRGNHSTIFCAFFGKQALDYVNCAYKLSARIDYQADTCTTALQQTSPTPILGPNKAAFTLEQRTVQTVKELIFNGPGRFAGMVEGFAKNKFVRSLNCNSLMRTHTVPANTHTHRDDTASETVTVHRNHPHTGTATQSITQSISELLVPTRTEVLSESGTPSETRSLASSHTVTPVKITWLATSGVYADATNQVGRYQTVNGVVTDRLTGIQWEQAASSTMMPQSASASYCATQTTSGFTDWRLPTVFEFESLFDYTIPYQGTVPGINTTAFPNAPTTLFWSSTPVVGVSGQHWYASFGQGACYAGLILAIVSGFTACAPDSGYVRCVRGNSLPSPTNRYQVSSGVVKDQKTGLVWQQKATGGTMPWSSAAAHCTGLVLGGLTWRLPTVKELATIVDYSVTQGGLMMDATAFAGESNTWYWSSSAVVGNPNGPWAVGFSFGGVGNGNVGNGPAVRCVAPS